MEGREREVFVELIIRSQHIDVSESLKEHGRRQVERAVRPFRSQVQRVELLFVDLNGPRRGLGQACRIFVSLASGRTVTHECRARDYYAAASSVTHRLSRTLPRLHERLCDHASAEPTPLEVA